MSYRPPVIPTRPPVPTVVQQVELEDLPGLGWVQLKSLGEENLYLEASDGRGFFVKLG